MSLTPARWTVGLTEQQIAAAIEPLTDIIADGLDEIRFYFRTYHGARQLDFTGDDPLFYETLNVELGIRRAVARDMPLGEIGYLLQLVHRIRSAPTEPARLIVLEEVRRVYDESIRTGQTEMSEPLGFLLRRHGHPTASGNQNPAPPAPEGNGKPDEAPASGTALPEATNPRGSLKEPPQKAIAAYRAVKIMGQKQANVAPRFGVGQGSISRWVTQVSAWIAAGNILPDLDAPKPKTIAMDPRKLEQGPPRSAHKLENMRDPSR